jgi:predicted small integral membrane protein
MLLAIAVPDDDFVLFQSAQVLQGRLANWPVHLCPGPARQPALRLKRRRNNRLFQAIDVMVWYHLSRMAVVFAGKLTLPVMDDG